MEFKCNYSSCEEQGIDSNGVINFIKRIKEKNIKLHTFTLSRNEHIVAEVNAFPYSNDYRHIVNSVTKTFTSIAVGIAYDRGLIKLNDKIHCYFDNPNYKNNGLENATIHNLLTMTLGQDMWPVIDKENDWCERVFDKHITDEPGSIFFYNSMCSHILSAIITKVTGKSEFELLKENFFEPCGIKDCYWREDPSGYSTGGFGLYISGKDLIKLGQLYLNKGVLNGHRILSEEWCNLATTKRVDTCYSYPKNKIESIQGYGYQMWMCSHNAYRASGLFGQVCVVIPDKNVVFSINSSTTGSQPLLDIFFETIYPCIKDNVLPENKENIKKIKDCAHILDTESLKGNHFPYYLEKINNKELKYKNKNKKIVLTFDNDICNFKILDESKTYECKLKNNDFIGIESNFDMYIGNYYAIHLMTKDRPIDMNPITYGSYAWVSSTHLKILVIFKDHTSYNYWDIYFDDKFARIDERFTYVNEDGDYLSKNVLIMPESQ